VNEVIKLYLSYMKIALRGMLCALVVFSVYASVAKIMGYGGTRLSKDSAYLVLLMLAFSVFMFMVNRQLDKAIKSPKVQISVEPNHIPRLAAHRQRVVIRRR
jgi:predicted Co/Zn/Cd cation transporter (cation efflux family)